MGGIHIMITGRRVVAFLWIVGGGLITTGVSFWSTPGALVVAGLLIIIGTATIVDIDDRKSANRRDPRTLRRVPRGESDNPPRMFPAPDQRKAK